MDNNVLEENVADSRIVNFRNAAAGGLIGVMESNNIIINSYAAGSIELDNDSERNLFFPDGIGGLVGSYRPVLENLTPEEPALFSEIIDYSYSQMQIDSQEYWPVTGGLVGGEGVHKFISSILPDPKPAEAAYWNGDQQGGGGESLPMTLPALGGVSRTERQMKGVDTNVHIYINWNTTDIWNIVERAYPNLQWEDEAMQK